MRKLYLFVIAALCSYGTQAQLLMPADGGSVKAAISERIGITDVSISYGRPAVKGREGKIWGGLVYAGYQNPGFGSGQDVPWRAGANENTVIAFSTDVLVEGRLLHAGKYGFFVAYGPTSCTLIFSSNTTSWGSFFYDSKEDVLRVNVKPVATAESRERLTYEFSNETDSGATISLVWEKLAIPFTVTTQLQQLQLASFDMELRGEKGFDPHALQTVADYLLTRNMRLDDALKYADMTVQQMPTFSALTTKAQILEKMNKQAQADSVMQDAMSKGNTQELHRYGRTLLQGNKKQKAFEVFQYNYKHYPNTYTTNVGMARGYAAIGKPKDALKYANAALPQAPNDLNKQSVEDMISKLKEGKEL